MLTATSCQHRSLILLNLSEVLNGYADIYKARSHTGSDLALFLLDYRLRGVNTPALNDVHHSPMPPSLAPRDILLY
jgi:hypothetical protein